MFTKFSFSENDPFVILFDLRQPTATQLQRQIEIQKTTWHFFWIVKLAFQKYFYELSVSKNYSMTKQMEDYRAEVK